MKPREPVWRRRLFPLGAWETVDGHELQEQMRQIFARWGLPERIRVDRGSPWGLHHGLPEEMALWWIGLGIGVTWNRARSPQQNGTVERSHGTSGRWCEPQTCADCAALAQRLERANTLQRELYPAVNGQSRAAAYPTLLAGGRPYDPTQEEAAWELERVCRYFEQGVWHRRVDKSGVIYLYNWRYYVGAKWKYQTVTVRFDGERKEWILRTESGEELRRYPAEQITRERIVGLTVSHRKGSTKTEEQVQHAAAV